MSDHGIGLADAIDMLRGEFLTARARARNQEVRFPVNSMKVELQVAVTKTAGGKAAFTVPFVNVGVGASGGWQQENLQKVTVEFGAPTDSRGPFPVGDDSP